MTDRSLAAPRPCLRAGLLLLMLLAGLAPARAATTPPSQPALTQADAQQLLTVLNDPAKLAALKTTLANLQKAVPAASPAPIPFGLPAGSLGGQIFVSLDAARTGLVGDGRDIGRTLRAAADIRPWLAAILTDPVRRDVALGALGRLALVLGAAFAVCLLVDRLIRSWVDALARLAQRYALPAHVADLPPAGAADADLQERSERRRHHVSFVRMLHGLQRVPFGLLHFALELLPIISFALVAVAFELGGLAQRPQNLAVLQAALSVFVVGGAIIALLHSLFAPAQPSLRLILVSDEVARRISFWLWLMVVIGAAAIALLNVATMLGLPAYAGAVAAKTLVLVEHSLLAVLIFRSRKDMARSLSFQSRRSAAYGQLLAGLGRTLWIPLIVVDFGLWLIWAAQLKDGYIRLLTASTETALVILGARLLRVALLGALERAFNLPGDDERPWYSRRAAYYYPLMRRFAKAIVLAGTIVALLQVWGLGAFGWFAHGAIGGRLLAAFASTLVAVVIGIIAWEVGNIALETHINRLQQDNAVTAARVARVRTLMPMLRILLFIFIATVLVMTVLSEVGVNIAPLLGGAGIIGVAIGFGSQKLVQDFITGIFLLLENAMQVGDSVTCAGVSGVVEHLSIRTLHLRAGDGALLIIPFSSVTTVTNTNRGLGNAPVSVELDPAEDTDRVAEILKAIVTEMRREDAFGTGMLSDLQYWGVDKVSTQSVTLVGQIVCTDAARYGVQREFNRRMKKRFEAEGIQLAQPLQTVQLRTAAPAPAPSAAPGSPPPGVVKDSPPSTALGHTE